MFRFSDGRLIIPFDVPQQSSNPAKACLIRKEVSLAAEFERGRDYAFGILDALIDGGTPTKRLGSRFLNRANANIR